MPHEQIRSLEKHAVSGALVDHPEWKWADLDRKRLVWVTKGVLYAAKIHGQGLGDVKLLHDFNDMTFEALAAHTEPEHDRANPIMVSVAPFN